MRIGRTLATLGGLVLVALGAGCAGRPVVEPLGPNRFRLKCTTALPRCLTEASGTTCPNERYIVERAVSDLNLRGMTPYQTEYRASEAIIQCRQRNEMGDPLAVVETPAAEDDKAAPKSACVPGATQACVGPGACRGGQVCRADGGGYLSCDCGPPPAAPPPPAP